MSELIIKEFGSDIIDGLPKGQTITMAGMLYEETMCIWEELVRSPNQVLTIEDIIEELERIPKRFRQIVNYIILSPYTSSENPNWIASANCDGIRKITIYKTRWNREESKTRLSWSGALFHEVGHILDCYARSKTDLVSKSDGWLEAEKLDSQGWDLSTVKRSWVSFYDQVCNDSKEDFAESFKMLYMPESEDRFRKDFPNRTKFIEELII